MDREIEKIKKEYEEKLKQKKAKKKAKDDDKAKQDDDDDTGKTEKERDEKVVCPMSHRSGRLTSDQIKAVQTGSAETPPDDGPRVFALHRSPTQNPYYNTLCLTYIPPGTSIRCALTGCAISRLPNEINSG